jgi:hypothetical protein
VFSWTDERGARSSFFYASSACIYPEGKQLDVKVEGGGLKEQDAWPAQARAACPRV